MEVGESRTAPHHTVQVLDLLYWHTPIAAAEEKIGRDSDGPPVECHLTRCRSLPDWCEGSGTADFPLFQALVGTGVHARERKVVPGIGTSQ